MRVLLIFAIPLALAACNETPPADPAAVPSAPATIATTNATVQPVPGASATAGSTATPSASKTPMPGNPTPIPANAPPSACGADKAARFVGRIATPETRARLIEAVGHNRIRWNGPDTVVTMDFSEGRLNVMLDAADRITGTKCG